MIKVNSELSFKTNDNKTDLIVDIEENNKTGNLLLAGTVSGDRGFGASFGANDKNIFGSGNSLQSSFDFNDETLSFNLSYRQYPILNSRISNDYYLTNDENDYISYNIDQCKMLDKKNQLFKLVIKNCNVFRLFPGNHKSFLTNIIETFHPYSAYFYLGICFLTRIVSSH